MKKGGFEGEQIHLKCKREDVPKGVLLCGDPGRARLVAEKFFEDGRMINEFRGLLSFAGVYKGVSAAVVTTGMGAPSACIVVEELANLGVKYVIRIGTCGAAKEGVEVGDLVIPNGAVPLTGILEAYGVPTLPPVPDYSVLSALVSAAEALKHKYWIGLICTSDAFYREEALALEWSKRGILAFEMECAGVFGVSQLRGVRAGAVLAVTGNILKGEGVIQSDVTRSAIHLEIELALDALTTLLEGRS